MTDAVDLAKFWNQEHTADSGWLTGTSWQAMKQYYGITDRDIQGKNCLEIGVGKATVTRELARLAAKLYCCDISTAALAKVKDFAAQTWLTQDLAQAPPVDAVLCHLVLVHCDDLECQRILRCVKVTEQGRIFCQFSCFKDETLGIQDASPSVQQMLDPGRKHWFRTMQQIQDIVDSAGLEIHNIKSYDPGGYFGWHNQIWQFLELRPSKKEH